MINDVRCKSKRDHSLQNQHAEILIQQNSRLVHAAQEMVGNAPSTTAS
ncbi:hypothetical protein RBSWK_00876 [Rhodopirellula baltica SWK14]|uniref:Uncharacterized protein n=1 Tax=Rhodopirellula baltica SWK14 TaxID=993516 RepID=L7CMJ7_RHOBT|nr:hypothetical protein RBSWK_00876 [Rhodopirellula baltica SWK14]